MRFTRLAAVSFAISVAPIGVIAATPAPTSIAAAVASTVPVADNVKLDAGRKPAQVLQFLGLKPGMNVLDLFGANAYWAEITAPVVGPKGHVTVWKPTQFYGEKRKQAFADVHRRSTRTCRSSSSPFEAPICRKIMRTS